MNTTLYKDVFGTDAPAKEKMQELMECLKALPDNIFKAMQLYYTEGKTKEAVAEEMGVPEQLVERWLKSGVKVLRVFHEERDDS